jgi:hypothetical protein
LNKQSCSVAATNSTFGDPCVGKSKKLAVTYTCDKGEAPPPNPDPNSVLPVFLLAGQSNMEGNVNRDLLMEILSELVQGPQNTLQQRVEAPLTRWYTTAQPSVYSAQTVTHEAEELIRIRATGVVGSALLTPLPNIFCSKNDSGIKPLQVGAGCGNPFGPELVLGHYLKTTPHAPTSLIKVAKGGTTLLTDWRSPSAVAASGGAVGEWYTKLEQRIGSITSAPATVHPRCSVGKCRWAAFIWFQGENDCFNPANADPYQQNLTYLLKDVRAKIGNAKLPVLVVEIGPWAQGLSNGYKVVAAQRAVVAADANAELVPTSDLSSHYHFDPAAQLIIGYRVANVLAPMLK